MPDEAGRHAVTHYAVGETYGEAALVRCRLETGRTHQIRVHLAHSGHPIVGDPKYGDFARNKAWARENGLPRMVLHARDLAFDHPADGRRIALHAPLPADCAGLLPR